MSPVIVSFELALNVNGERLGSNFECNLFKAFIERFPYQKEELWRSACNWVGDDNFVALNELKNIMDQCNA